MKRVLIAGLLAVFSLAATRPVSGRDREGAVAEILIRLEHQWVDAGIRKDRAALDRILAEDWVGIDFQGGSLNKIEFLQSLELRPDTPPGQSPDMTNMRVRLFGNTAIVSGTQSDSGRYQAGDYVWTDVFVQRSGHWQAVSSQSTKIRRTPAAETQSPNTSEINS